MTSETAIIGLALTAGLAGYGLVRPRRPRRLARAVGVLIAGLGVAGGYWVIEPEGLGGIGYALVRGSVLLFVVLPSAIAVTTMEVQHRRRNRHLGE